jgi:hypothetical protein
MSLIIVTPTPEDEGSSWSLGRVLPFVSVISYRGSAKLVFINNSTPQPRRYKPNQADKEVRFNAKTRSAKPDSGQLSRRRLTGSFGLGPKVKQLWASLTKKGLLARRILRETFASPEKAISNVDGSLGPLTCSLIAPSMAVEHDKEL